MTIIIINIIINHINNTNLFRDYDFEYICQSEYWLSIVIMCY